MSKVMKLEGKNKTWMEILFFFLCFAVPVVLMALAWGDMGISMGGEVTPFIHDMETQYMPLFTSLRYVFEGNDSLFYTWETALGGNNWGTMAYYMGSPLSWIMVLFSVSNMPEAIYVVTLLKIGLCGLAFATFIRFGISTQKCGFQHVVFSCCYALMSYTVMYSCCLMWLDGVILLPLILLGIEKMLEGKKGFVYFLSIFSLFLCSYYISYMIGIFAALYLLCRIICVFEKQEWKKGIEVLVRFGWNTFLALGCAAPVLVPGLKSIALGKGTMSKEQAEMMIIDAYHFTLPELLQKLLPMQYDSISNTGLPSVFCGSAMLILAVVYLFQKKHSTKEKIGYVVLLAAPVLGFLIPEVDYVWHGFRWPNAFPYRYAFLFSMVILILAWKAYQELPKNKDLAKILVVMGVCYTFAEVYMNSFWIVSSLHKEYMYVIRVEYEQYIEQHEGLVDLVKQEDGFFRTEFVNDYLVDNNAYIWGLNSASCYVSTYNGAVNKFLCDMGGEEYSIFASAEKCTPLGDSLLGIRYRLNQEETFLGYEYKSDSSKESKRGITGIYLHENPNALSLGYMVDAEGTLNGLTMTENPFLNQNQLLDAFGLANSKVFREIEYQMKEDEKYWYLEFEVPAENPVYFYVDGYKNWVQKDENTGKVFGLDRKIRVVVNGDEENYRRMAHLTNQLLEGLKPCEKTVLKISKEALDLKQFLLYEMDMQVYQGAIDELSVQQLNVTEVNGGGITGKIEVLDSDGILFTTIPADGGHVVKVDGQNVESVVVLDTFLAIPLGQGKHEVEISYMPPGFKLGMFISILAILFTFLYFSNKKTNFLHRNGCKNC